jgi:UPF0271 protein
LAIAQAQAIAHGQPIDALDGGQLVLRADTLCLHGDGENAVEIARGLGGSWGGFWGSLPG